MPSALLLADSSGKECRSEDGRTPATSWTSGHQELTPSPLFELLELNGPVVTPCFYAPIIGGRSLPELPGLGAVMSGPGGAVNGQPRVNNHTSRPFTGEVRAAAPHGIEQ